MFDLRNTKIQKKKKKTQLKWNRHIYSDFFGVGSAHIQQFAQCDHDCEREKMKENKWNLKNVKNFLCKMNTFFVHNFQKLLSSKNTKPFNGCCAILRKFLKCLYLYIHYIYNVCTVSFVFSFFVMVPIFNLFHFFHTIPCFILLWKCLCVRMNCLYTRIFLLYIIFFFFYFFPFK